MIVLRALIRRAGGSKRNEQRWARKITQKVNPILGVKIRPSGTYEMVSGGPNSGPQIWGRVHGIFM